MDKEGKCNRKFSIGYKMLIEEACRIWLREHGTQGEQKQNEVIQWFSRFNTQIIRDRPNVGGLSFPALFTLDKEGVGLVGEKEF